ncbi:MAG: c-type cytochrome [Casimicrobiaceae bacterium]
MLAIPAAAQSGGGAAPPKTAICAACHGPNGHPASPRYPELAGQTARYIYLQLKDFQEGRRSDPEMTPMSKDLSKEEMLDLASYYAAQKPAPSTFKADPAKVMAGRKKADETLCVMCHLTGFAGQNEIPRVAGQSYEYIVKQLTDFKERRRTNDAGNMTSVARTLSDEDIESLAHFLANLS